MWLPIVNVAQQLDEPVSNLLAAAHVQSRSQYKKSVKMFYLVISPLILQKSSLF